MSASTSKRNKIYYLLWAVGAVAYMALALLAPTNTSNTFNLSKLQLTGLSLSIMLPVVLIWLAAVYGAERVKSYAATIIDSDDGKAFNTLAHGLTVLAFGSIITSLLSSGRRYLQGSPSYVDYIHLSQFTQLLVYLTATFLIWRGSSALMKLVSNPSSFMKPVLVLAVPYIALASWYISLMLSNPYRNTTPDVAKHQSYFLSDPALILGIIIPYLLVWAFGLLAIINIVRYRQSVKGTLYRHALKNLSIGIVVVVIFTMVLQLLSTAGDAFTGASLAAVLMLVYGIILLYSVGFIIIATGAKKLAKLEEV
jgi:hypothetical protein